MFNIVIDIVCLVVRLVICYVDTSFLRKYYKRE
jgi:hypothetical protein